MMRGPMEYDESHELTRYVWSHCHHLIKDVEHRANRAGMAKIKADSAEQNVSEALGRVLRKRWGYEEDAEVQAALAAGYDAFRERVTRRLLSDVEVQATINRCPKCGRVVRTPLARQCLWCNHAWRD